MNGVILTLLINCFLISPLLCESKAYFSPQDNIAGKLIDLINSTKKSIHIAIYQLTSKPIAEALKNAHKRGVALEIVTDNSTYKAASGKLDLLKQEGIIIYAFKQKQSNTLFKPLMHNKYAIFDIDGHEKITWTGSFNWTQNANNINRENAFYTSNKKIFQQYNANFESLKKECVLKSEKNKQENQNNNGQPEADQSDTMVKKIKEFLHSVKKYLATR